MPTPKCHAKEQCKALKKKVEAAQALLPEEKTKCLPTLCSLPSKRAVRYVLTAQARYAHTQLDAGLVALSLLGVYGRCSDDDSAAVAALGLKRDEDARSSLEKALEDGLSNLDSQQRYYLATRMLPRVQGRYNIKAG